MTDTPTPLKALTWKLDPTTLRLLQRLKVLEGEAFVTRPAQDTLLERWLTGLQLRYRARLQEVEVEAHTVYAETLLTELERDPMPELPRVAAHNTRTAMLLLGRNLPEAFTWLQIDSDKQVKLLQQPRFLDELVSVITPTPAAIRPSQRAPRLLLHASGCRSFPGTPLQPHSLASLLDLPGLAWLQKVALRTGQALYAEMQVSEPETALASLRHELVQARCTRAYALLQAWKGAA